jgi:hypothetical protein
MKMMLLKVSRGQQFNFAVNGRPVSGIITGSHNYDPEFASVGVETEDQIPNGAHVTIPDCPEAVCFAHPIANRDRIGVILKIPLSCIDVSTIGQ